MSAAAREADLISQWGLTRDGAVFETRYGNRLTPVLTRDGRFAMLKIIASEDEKPGVPALAEIARAEYRCSTKALAKLDVRVKLRGNEQVEGCP